MPIPNDYTPKVPEKKEYELLPDDTYQVEITKLEFKPDEPVFEGKPGEVEDKFSFEFTVVEEGEYKGRKLWQDMRTIMSAGSNGYSPSWLYKVFCAVNKVALSEDEAKSVTGADYNSMIGEQLRLVVKQEPNRKGVRKNKIKDMLPVKGSVIAITLPIVSTEETPPLPDNELPDF